MAGDVRPSPELITWLVRAGFPAADLYRKAVEIATRASVEMVDPLLLGHLVVDFGPNGRAPLPMAVAVEEAKRRMGGVKDRTELDRVHALGVLGVEEPPGPTDERRLCYDYLTAGAGAAGLEMRWRRLGGPTSSFALRSLAYALEKEAELHDRAPGGGNARALRQRAQKFRSDANDLDRTARERAELEAAARAAAEDQRRAILKAERVSRAALGRDVLRAIDEARSEEAEQRRAKAEAPSKAETGTEQTRAHTETGPGAETGTE